MNRRIAAIVCAIGITGCSTTQVGLKYETTNAPARVAVDAQPIGVGSFVDQRGEPANYVGAIRGGFGNPLKSLETEKPVSDLVHAAFEDGLHARGVTIERGSTPFQLAGVIRKLDCNQMARREANVEIELSVTDRASGLQRFSRTYSASNVEGSVMTLKAGVFASVEDLRTLTERTLRETVDKALDDSALRAALKL